MDGILNNLKYRIENGITPIKSALETYNKDRIAVKNLLNNNLE